MKRYLLAIVLIMTSIMMFAQPGRKVVELKAMIDSIRTEQYDTVRDAGYWKRALRHGDLNIYDKSVRYPKFLQFCVDVYRWGDKTFNSYDTAYVVSTKKNWKVMFKNNNWLDSYAGRLGDREMPIGINSHLTTAIGGEIAFMAVNYSYMLDLDNLLGGDKNRHYKSLLSFTCSLLYMEWYKYKNDGYTNIHRFGEYKDGRWINERFSGVKRESYGWNTYYFFNNKKYSQAAAYCYSKYQKKSAGSFIAGVTLSVQNTEFDFSSLLPTMRSYLPDERELYKFNYRDIGFLLGYGYNFVLKHKWLINVTGLPSIGYKHCFENSIDGRRNLFSFNIQGKLGVVKNSRNFFYALHGRLDGHWYRSSSQSLFNSVEDFTFTAGFRF